MVKTLAAFGLIISFSACTGSGDRLQLKAINDCLESSNHFIEIGSLAVRKDMENKLMDPYSHSSALIWVSPATSIRQPSADLRNYIDSLKSILQKEQEFNKDRKKELFQKLIACKHLVPMIFDTIVTDNPRFKNDVADLTQQLPLLHGYPLKMDKDQITSYGRNWIDSNFSSIDPLMTLASLNKIQNDIDSWEYQLLRYCNIHIQSYLCGFDSPFLAATSNSNLKAGQPFAVYAGVLDFPLFRNPRITIDGTLIKPGLDGIAACVIKAAANKGKHPIRVTIEYTQPDGTRQKVFKTLEYTVAE